MAAAKSDQNRSADSSAAANCVFVHFSNFGALWWPNRWSDFYQILSQEWIIPLYLWFNFHPIPPSGSRVTREVVTQNTHPVHTLAWYRMAYIVPNGLVQNGLAPNDQLVSNSLGNGEPERAEMGAKRPISASNSYKLLVQAGFEPAILGFDTSN